MSDSAVMDPTVANSGVMDLTELEIEANKDSVIIMDNAPIHQGKQFDETKNLLNASKSIKLELLPPYSPFLNPIKYSFHSIKSYIQTQEPKN
ncbi:hypothetical protein PCASD_11701 [Puccinia coronata f. sp. avenae]|uniref:Tc1-like transposase DDE domain-containing protein n=1 Tax=Puccinia coronata f. sp. avenae TaxID=200324 RepID=A0A2N5UME5_9BASI|nr:hypothetical protein PCASD_11701 [Puccinia coronata f. sp. avenae]